MKDFQWKVVFLAPKTDAVRFYISIIFNFLLTYFSKTFYRWRSGCRWWNNWPLNSILTVSNLYQAFIGLGVFLSLGSLYGLGSWFASQKPSSLLDVKTTQEGFLEVSKILGKVNKNEKVQFNRQWTVYGGEDHMLQMHYPQLQTSFYGKLESTRCAGTF